VGRGQAWGELARDLAGECAALQEAAGLAVDPEAGPEAQTAGGRFVVAAAVEAQAWPLPSRPLPLLRQQQEVMRLTPGRLHLHGC
jgi:hypothetical protein